MPDYTIAKTLSERSVNCAAEMVLGGQPVRAAVRELNAKGYDSFIPNPNDLDLFTSTTLRMRRIDSEVTSILQRYGLRIESTP